MICIYGLNSRQKCCRLLDSESESISPLQITQLFWTDQGSRKCLLRFLCVIKRAENAGAVPSLSLQWVREERRLISVFNFRVSPAVTIAGDGSCERLFSCRSVADVLTLGIACQSQTGTDGWQIKGSTKCRSKVSGLHVPPNQLQCNLGLNLQVSGALLEGANTVLPKDIPSSGVLMMVKRGMSDMLVQNLP